MVVTLEEMMAALPDDRRSRVKARAAELITEEMTLRELRKAMGKTQAQVARVTGKPQATISRMEANADMLLSNLDDVVRALGGRVRIIAELPGGPPVLLRGLGDLTNTPLRPAPVKQKAKPATKAQTAKMEGLKRPAKNPTKPVGKTIGPSSKTHDNSVKRPAPRVA